VNSDAEIVKPPMPPQARPQYPLGQHTASQAASQTAAKQLSGGAVGIGTSLVLDEFALILHLQDVYWSGEGQLSVEAVSLTAACLGLALAGFSPFGVRDVDNIELTLRLTATGILIADGVLALICVLKGKYRTALFGLFLPPVGVIGALRLARPSSIWARHRYRGKRLERATRRRHRSALGPSPDRLGRLRRRETVPAQPACQRRRPPLNPARDAQATPGPLAGCVGPAPTGSR